MATWIVLTDDWELRGNGTGRVEDLQQRPATRLMDLYEKLGIRSSFNIEVLQQLAFERHAGRDAAVRNGRDAWISTVRQMVRRGFDIQLHLHPQWLDAALVDGWWKLGTRWHIADYGHAEIARMLDEALAYLGPLAEPNKIVSFRGGSWGIGPPSRAIFTALAARGIKIDVSIVNGIRYDGEGIRLDYTRLDQPFRPYRPDLDDARRVARNAAQAASVIEIPTQSVSRRELAGRLRAEAIGPRRLEASRAMLQLARGSNAVLRGKGAARRLMNLIRKGRGSGSIPDFVMSDAFGFLSGAARSDVIFDLSSPYPPLMFERMADICMERVDTNTGLAVLVVENHTKDLQQDADFARIEALIEHIRTRHPGVEFRTLADVAQQADRLP